MWLLWFVPLPALRNENRPAINNVDLWCVTVSLLSGKTVVDRNFSASGFINHGDFHAVAETARALHRDQIDVFHHCIFFDHVIGDAVPDPADNPVDNSWILMSFYCLYVSRHAHHLEGDDNYYHSSGSPATTFHPESNRTNTTDYNVINQHICNRAIVKLSGQ